MFVGLVVLVDGVDDVDVMPDGIHGNVDAFALKVAGGGKTGHMQPNATCALDIERRKILEKQC
jgi:hypothetical protein